MATQDEYIKTALRLPRHLHADISVSAENAGRSMNAEIIDRLSKSSDLGHLHRVIEQLSQTMQSEREGEQAKLGLILMIFEQTVTSFEEALKLSLEKHPTEADYKQFYRDISNARASMGAIAPMAKNPFSLPGKP